jgi:hypothetical protein
VKLMRIKLPMYQFFLWALGLNNFVEWKFCSRAIGMGWP